MWPPHISSIIPASIIPRWFNNQHVGKDSFINIKDASHIMQHDNNCIGVACKGNGSSKTERKFMEYIHLHFGVVLVTDESDHMLLFYLNQFHFIKIINCS
ncbi:hypothetical protein GLYMA_06G263600v4 [Glycine max]|uniref:Uncharacterized protein n=1 Tax=Glycine max TaxID=3847 RepID=K7KXJ2_SOYBN|nr:hypothetical protein GYH30_016348 [Glycine max]KRH55578.1 hypothetical protein GLYMA_06G263600v4 [Glycine max]